MELVVTLTLLAFFSVFYILSRYWDSLVLETGSIIFLIIVGIVVWGTGLQSFDNVVTAEINNTGNSTITYAYTPVGYTIPTGDVLGLIILFFSVILCGMLWLHLADQRKGKGE